MPIQPISRSSFEELHPDDSITRAGRYEEVEWFVERSRTLLAFIAKDTQSNEWSFVIQGRDERGRFHAVEFKDHLSSQDDARMMLVTAVRQLMASGVKVFPSPAYSR